MKNRKGFTIVELVIVIAVIAILAAVLIPTFSGVIGRANDSAALQTARSTLTNALNMSSAATLAGQTATGVYKTNFLVTGYAYGYTGNELKQIDYPGSENVATLKKGAKSVKDDANFNSILISAEDFKSTLAYKAATADDLTSNLTIYSKDSNNNYVKVASPVTADLASYYVIDEANTTYEIDEEVTKIIVAATDIASITSIKKVNGVYYINYDKQDNQDATFDCAVYLNSDFAKKVVVLTTFG